MTGAEEVDRLLQELERNLESTKLSFKGTWHHPNWATVAEKLTGYQNWKESSDRSRSMVAM